MQETLEVRCEGTRINRRGHHCTDPLGRKLLDLLHLSGRVVRCFHLTEAESSVTGSKRETEADSRHEFAVVVSCEDKFLRSIARRGAACFGRLERGQRHWFGQS
jgi:hypothetical protein